MKTPECLNEPREGGAASFQSAKRQKSNLSMARQDRNKSTLKAFSQIMKDCRATNRQHYSNLYSKQSYSHISVGQKTLRAKEEPLVADGKEFAGAT